MGCYCGCGTKGNKIRWTLAILFMLLGVGFLIGIIVSFVNAHNDYVDCLDELVEEGKITKRQRDYAKDHSAFNYDQNIYIDECLQDHIWPDPPIGTFFWLVVAFFIAGSVQFCIMCCCVKSPEELYREPVYYASNVQMTKV